MSNMRTLALMLLGTMAAVPQTPGTLRGVLTDSSGAIIPGATVSLTTANNARTATSQTDGLYTFVGLTPGEYTIKVNFPGFEAFEKAVTMDSGKSLQFPIQLTPSGGKQEVTVSGGKG